MRRLNVKQTQIDQCISSSVFALSRRPKNPELRKGELLLLQLVRNDAAALGKLHSRIDYALVFDHIEGDPDGTIIREHWPTAGRVWPWIVYASATIPAILFSLEDIGLERYLGQVNPMSIEEADEALIAPFIQWELAENPEPERRVAPLSTLVQSFSIERTLSAIYNHDRIALLRPVPQKLVLVEKFERNAFLAESVKACYGNRCQICGADFSETFGVQIADAHHIKYLRNGGPDISANLIVLCPNHHRINPRYKC